MDQRHYTINEELYLAIGVLKYGVGSWSEIRDDPSIPIFRSNVSMKDHRRFLCNKGRTFELLRAAEKLEEKVNCQLRQ